jgi:4-diphosphocytidyl-2C-methyl-D-erythritol kinase
VDDVERRVTKLEEQVSAMRDNYATLLKVGEMLKPIESAMADMRASVKNLSVQVESVFDMYKDFLRDKAEQEKQITREKIEQAQRVAEEKIEQERRTAQEKIEQERRMALEKAEQERRIADEQIAALRKESLTNRIRKAAQIVGLVVGLIAIATFVYGLLKYISTHP